MASDRGHKKTPATESVGDAQESCDHCNEYKNIVMAFSKASLFLEHCPTVWGPPDINRTIPTFLSNVATFGAEFAVTSKEDDTAASANTNTGTDMADVSVASTASDVADTMVSSIAGTVVDPAVDFISALPISLAGTLMDPAVDLVSALSISLADLTTGSDESETNNADFASVATLADAVVPRSVNDVSTTCSTTTNTIVSDTSVCSNSSTFVSGVNGSATTAGSTFKDATVLISGDVDNFSPIEKIIATDSLDTILRTVVYYFAVQRTYGTFAADTLGVMSSKGGGKDSRFFKHAKLDQCAANILLIQRAWISICAGDPFVYRFHILRTMLLGLEQSSSASASTSKGNQLHKTYSYANPLEDSPLLPTRERLKWIDRKNSLIHAMKCDNPLGNKSEECTKATCSMFKFVLSHIKKCTSDRNCVIDGCIETKRTVKHWKICNKTCCRFCLVGKLLFMLQDKSFISEVADGGMPESIEEFCKKVRLESARKTGSANAASSQCAATGSNAAFLNPSTRQGFEMIHLNVIQQRTFLTVHTLLCEDQDGWDFDSDKVCDVPFCYYVVHTITHIARCVEGIFCPVQYCFAIKLTMRHFKTCRSVECHICAPVCLLLRLRKEYKVGTLPKPLEHLMVERLFTNSLQAHAVLMRCPDRRPDSSEFGFPESNEGDSAGGVQDGSNLPRFFTATETKSPQKRASSKKSSKKRAKK